MKTEQEHEHLAYEVHFYVHNGYYGSSYGTPKDPMRITDDDAQFILDYLKEREGKDYSEECSKSYPPVQFAEEGTNEYEGARKNRFLFFGRAGECVVERNEWIMRPHPIDRTRFQDAKSEPSGVGNA